MQRSVQTTEAIGLRTRLRGTWIHAVFAKLREIKRRLMRRSEGEAFLLRKYTRLHGHPPNLTDPRKFTEKLFHRMIILNRGGHQSFTELSDKYLVRTYVAGKVGEEYLTKLLWQGNDLNQIPFDALPMEYVIKSNHACRQVIVVKGNTDRSEIKHRVSRWLTTNHYWANREHQYYQIKPRVLVEEYLRSSDGGGPLDYRFWCFGGTPEVIQVDNQAHDINPFLDTRWDLLDLHYRNGAMRPHVPKPLNFDQMMSVAARLSAPFDFVRVDLYNIEGKIYFGELTFTPVGGGLKLRPESWDVKLGEKWKMASLS